MRAIMVMFDSLNRKLLPNYGCRWTKMPNFIRLGNKTTTFDTFYGGSMPCMPARRELHTGRYNFLHSCWSPMQPYDDSIITRLRKHNIYTHICTDHFHYWEDGGSCYLTKFDSHDMLRGQQGDPWKGQVKRPYFPETLSRRCDGESWRHDWINRSFIRTEESMPQAKTFESGLDFLERNKEEDHWFLQIEVFDPHEPFYTQEQYKKLYPHTYMGKNIDWPDYGKNEYGEVATEHIRYEYAALLSMCDFYLGKILDFMDQNHMWEDTMLIVNTDHGFMLGEKEWMGKNVQPFYEEIIHIPFFIHDPREAYPNERRKSLAQTVDIVPTIAEFFGIEPPEFMNGRSLTPIIREDRPIREGALFGVFGGHINITDGRYVYMQAPINSNNQPLYDYTLMPCHMNKPFQVEELKEIELIEGFSFMKGAKTLKIPANAWINPYWYGNLLFDLKEDPMQENPIFSIDIQRKMLLLMRSLMIENEAPEEQYLRVGLNKNGDISVEQIKNMNKMEELDVVSEHIQDDRVKKIAMIGYTLLEEQEKQAFITEIGDTVKPMTVEILLEMIREHRKKEDKEQIIRMIKNYL